MAGENQNLAKTLLKGACSKAAGDTPVTSSWTQDSPFSRGGETGVWLRETKDSPSLLLTGSYTVHIHTHCMFIHTTSQVAGHWVLYHSYTVHIHTFMYYALHAE